MAEEDIRGSIRLAGWWGIVLEEQRKRGKYPGLQWYLRGASPEKGRFTLKCARVYWDVE